MYLIVYINGYGNYGSMIYDRCPKRTSDLRILEEKILKKALVDLGMSEKGIEYLEGRERVTIINIIPLFCSDRVRIPY